MLGTMMLEGMIASELNANVKGVSLVARLLVVRYAHRHSGSSSSHFPFLSIRDFLRQSRIVLLDALACPIALRISQRGHMLLNAILLEELRQIFAHKLWAIVGDDGLRDAKPANDVPPYKALYVRLSRGRHGLCFYPFGEVVGCHDHHASAPSSRRHRSYKVDCPLHERPRTRLRMYSSLAGSAGTGL